MAILEVVVSQFFFSTQNFILSGLACFFIYLVCKWIYRLTLHPLAKYPGPFLAKVTSWYSFYHGCRGDFHIDALRAHNKYGNVIRYGPNRLLANHDTSFGEIYDHNKNVKKSKAYLIAPGPTSIFSSIEKDLHRNRRKMITKGLSDSAMKDFEPAMLVHVRILCEKLLDRAVLEKGVEEWSPPRNMTDFCNWLAFDIITEYTLGANFRTLEDHFQRYIIDAMGALNIRTGAYVQFPELAYYQLEELLGYRAQRAGEKILSLTRGYVDTRIAKGADDKKDLFYSLMQGKDSETTQPQFSAADMSAESIFLILAGSDTTSTTLAGAFFYLAHNPHAYRELAKEVRRTFTSSEDIRTGPSLRSCRYLHACIYETLRMSPPVGWPMWREVAQGGTPLNGAHIPAGIDIGISMYALYHNEAVFKESFTFAPERWMMGGDGGPERLGDSDRWGSKTFLAAYNPFSIGPTSCLGRTFAMMELTITLARIFWIADFELAPAELGGHVGEGSPTSSSPGRQKPHEFQLRACLTSIPQGPILKFKRR